MDPPRRTKKCTSFHSDNSDIYNPPPATLEIELTNFFLDKKHSFFY